MVASKAVFVLRTHTIRVQTSSTAYNFKSVSDLKTFDSTDREDRFCEVGIQFFEYRLTETDRKTGDHTLDNSADRVAFCDFLIQVAFGFFCSFSSSTGSVHNSRNTVRERGVSRSNFWRDTR